MARGGDNTQEGVQGEVITIGIHGNSKQLAFRRSANTGSELPYLFLNGGAQSNRATLHGEGRKRRRRRA